MNRALEVDRRQISLQGLPSKALNVSETCRKCKLSIKDKGRTKVRFQSKEDAER